MMYTVTYVSHRGHVAVAQTPEGFRAALADKLSNPALAYNVVELVSHGSVRGSLMFRNGKWV